MQNELKLVIPSLTENVNITISSTGFFMKKNNAGYEETEEVQTAIAEAIENSMIHAYPNEIGTIYITIQITDNILTITVRDSGVGIEDVKKAQMPGSTTVNGRYGYGFSIMEIFMDDMKVTSAPGKGTTVTLKRVIKGV